jgi:glycosyltransferase involved in cell wall biosynthesis
MMNVIGIAPRRPAKPPGPETMKPKRFRVLHVVEASFAGVGRHVLDLAQELAVREHDVHIAYSPLRAEDRFLEELRTNARVKSVPIAMTRSPTLRDIFAARAVRKYLKLQGPFDIVHGHSSKGGAVAALAASGTTVPAVFTPNAFRTADPTLHPLARKCYRWLEAFLGGTLNARIIAVSEDERRHAIDLGIPSGKVVLIHNATRVSTHRTREEMRRLMGVPQDAVCVLFVGRLSSQKAPDRFVKAVHTLRTHGVKLHGLIGGFGPLEAAVAEQIAAYQLQHNMTMVKDQRGVDLMMAADIFVLTSRYEGLPYVLLEAAQLGLPIVATRVGGVDAVVEQGNNGYIVAQDTPEALENAIMTLALDPDLRVRMSDRAREKASSHSLEKMVDAVEALYAEVTGVGT